MTEHDIQTASLILTAASLIITIIGWTRTYKNQRLILERQLQAEKSRKNREVIFSQRLEQIDEIKIWFQCGEQLWRLHKSDNRSRVSADIQKKFTEWDLKLGKVKANASIIDNEFPPLLIPLGCLASLFVSSIKIFLQITDSEDGMRKLTKAIQKSPPLIELIDLFYELIENSLYKGADITEQNNDESDEIVELFGKAISYIDDIATNRLLARDTY